jgi:hypothetical protein
MSSFLATKTGNPYAGPQHCGSLGYPYRRYSYCCYQAKYEPYQRPDRSRIVGNPEAIRSNSHYFWIARLH